MRRAAACITPLLLLFVACGGAVAPDTGPTTSDPSPSGGSSSSGGSSTPAGACKDGDQGDWCPWGGCLDAPRATCVKGAWTCPAVPHCDPCYEAPKPDCKCGTPICDATARAWQCPRSCAPFVCGTTTCDQGSICLDRPPGIIFSDGGTPPDSFECAPLPAACAATSDCACVTKMINGSNCPVASCTEKDGNFFIGCIGE